MVDASLATPTTMVHLKQLGEVLSGPVTSLGKFNPFQLNWLGKFLSGPIKKDVISMQAWKKLYLVQFSSLFPFLWPTPPPPIVSNCSNLENAQNEEENAFSTIPTSHR
jgi:hypothetical protein